MHIRNSNKKKFRAIGHLLNPVVIISQKGLTKNVEKEINRALDRHELIKVKVIATTRTVKKELTSQICSRLSAECIQSIGHIILIYRAAKNPDPKLSNLIRKLA